MYLCLGIEPSFHVCYPPVLTNRLPEEKAGNEDRTRDSNLEGWRVTATPYPHFLLFYFIFLHMSTHIFVGFLESIVLEQQYYSLAVSFPQENEHDYEVL